MNDLGQDRIQYFNYSQGKIKKLGHVQLPIGGGPRHLKINSNP